MSVHATATQPQVACGYMVGPSGPYHISGDQNGQRGQIWQRRHRHMQYHAQDIQGKGPCVIVFFQVLSSRWQGRSMSIATRGCLICKQLHKSANDVPRYEHGDLRTAHLEFVQENVPPFCKIRQLWPSRSQILTNSNEKGRVQQMGVRGRHAATITR